MFVDGGGRLLRIESGFSLELSATVRHWFLTLQAFGIDFRYWVYTSDGVADRLHPGDPAARGHRPRILTAPAGEPAAAGGVLRT